MPADGHKTLIYQFHLTPSRCHLIIICITSSARAYYNCNQITAGPPKWKKKNGHDSIYKHGPWDAWTSTTTLQKKSHIYWRSHGLRDWSIRNVAFISPSNHTENGRRAQDDFLRNYFINRLHIKCLICDRRYWMYWNGWARSGSLILELDTYNGMGWIIMFVL